MTASSKYPPCLEMTFGGRERGRSPAWSAPGHGGRTHPQGVHHPLGAACWCCESRCRMLPNASSPVPHVRGPYRHAQRHGERERTGFVGGPALLPESRGVREASGQCGRGVPCRGAVARDLTRATGPGLGHVAELGPASAPRGVRSGAQLACHPPTAFFNPVATVLLLELGMVFDLRRDFANMLNRPASLLFEHPSRPLTAKALLHLHQLDLRSPSPGASGQRNSDIV